MRPFWADLCKNCWLPAPASVTYTAREPIRPDDRFVTWNSAGQPGQNPGPTADVVRRGLLTSASADGLRRGGFLRKALRSYAKVWIQSHNAAAWAAQVAHAPRIGSGRRGQCLGRQSLDQFPRDADIDAPKPSPGRGDIQTRWLSPTRGGRKWSFPCVWLAAAMCAAAREGAGWLLY